MVFDIDTYIAYTSFDDAEKFVMMCETQEEASIFCQYLSELGKTWADGSSYLSDNHYAYNPTCYEFVYGRFSDLHTCRACGYKILKFSDFEWNDYDDDLELSSNNILLNQFLSSFNS